MRKHANDRIEIPKDRKSTVDIGDRIYSINHPRITEREYYNIFHAARKHISRKRKHFHGIGSATNRDTKKRK